MSDQPSPASSASPGSMVWRGLRVLGIGIRTEPRPFTVAAIAAGIYGGMIVASSYVLGEVTDRVILPAFASGRTTTGALVAAAAAIIGVAVIKAMGVFGRRYGAYVMQYDLQAEFRRRVTRRYLRLPVAWHRQHTTGELLSNANADVEAAWWTIAPLPLSVGAIVLFAVAAVFLVVTDVFLAAVGLTLGPAMALLNWRYQRRMKVVATAAQQLRADTSERAHESFDAALVVKTLGREAAETEAFRQRSDELRDRMIEVGRLRAAFDPLVEALPNIAVLVVLAVGAWRVRGGFLTAGDLVAFAYLFRLLALPARVLGWMLGLMPRSVVGWERVERVLGAGGDLSYGRVTPDGSGGARLDTDAVSYTHPPTRAASSQDADVLAALGVTGGDAGPGDGFGDGADTSARQRRTGGVRAVSLDALPGRTLAIVGPTGSGKSTIAALLVRLVDPDAGAVIVDSHDIRDIDRGALTDDVALAFQDPFLFDETVAENIALGAPVSNADIREAARVAHADAFISQLSDGYDTRVGERGASLSGGQRQRIALARALVRRPRLLVMDDATSSVDPAVEGAILDNLADSDLVATVVVVAYRRSVIALADEVLYVEDGAVVARGGHRELLDRVPAYARLISAYDRAASSPTDDDHAAADVPA